MKPRKLIELRESVGLNQDRMAARLGVHLATYQQWEYGRRRMTATASKLVDVFVQALELNLVDTLFPEPPAKAKRRRVVTHWTNHSGSDDALCGTTSENCKASAFHPNVRVTCRKCRRALAATEAA